MKTTLISIMALPCLLVCFYSTGFSQQLPPMQLMQDEYSPRENITGVGTNSVIYVLPPNWIVRDAEGLVSHLKQYAAIESVLIDGSTIRIQTREILSGKDVNMIFDRLGMHFFQEITTTKKAY